MNILFYSFLIGATGYAILWITKYSFVIKWFLWRRWQFKRWINKDVSLLACHNNNLAGCRKHPVIYNDMCRIVRGVK